MTIVRKEIVEFFLQPKFSIYWSLFARIFLKKILQIISMWRHTFEGNLKVMTFLHKLEIPSFVADSFKLKSKHLQQNITVFFKYDFIIVVQKFATQKKHYVTSLLLSKYIFDNQCRFSGLSLNQLHFTSGLHFV